MANSKKCFDALLKENNIDVNKANGEGCTLLHLAAQKGGIDFVEALLRRAKGKIDTHKKDNKGCTPMDVLNSFKNDGPECNDYDRCKWKLQEYQKNE